MSTTAVFDYQTYNESAKLVADLRYKQHLQDGNNTSAAWRLLQGIVEYLNDCADQAMRGKQR